MEWYRVTYRAHSLRSGGAAIVRMNVKAHSPQDAINRQGNNPIRVPDEFTIFETWSVKAAYKLKDQKGADFIPINQMNKDGSAPTRYMASMEWVYDV